MRTRFVKIPPGDWRHVGPRWRHSGRVWDVQLGFGPRQLWLGWERYGEEQPMPHGRAGLWWYWVLLFAALIGTAWLVTVGRP